MLLTLLWTGVFLSVAHLKGGPHAGPFGVDFAHNMSGAYVMSHGGNPYDGDALVRGENMYLRSHGVPDHVASPDRALVWVAYPPLYLWALRPLLNFSFPLVATAWILFMVVFVAAGFVACLRFLGWSSRLLPMVLFLGMPQTTFQAYYANPAGPVIAVIMGALAIHRRWPLAAGLLLSLTWLKPQIGLPGFLLIALFAPGKARLRIASGLVAGTLGLLALTLAGPGSQSLVLWIRGMLRVSGIAGEQPNMIPLIGLYAGWASPALRGPLEAVSLCVAVGLTGWWWWRLRRFAEVPLHSVAWLWPVWLLALPYAHFPDEMLLAPAVLAVLGTNAQNITRAVPALCIYLLYFSTLLYNIEIAPHVQLLCLPLLVIAIAMYRHASRSLDSLKPLSGGGAGFRATTSDVATSAKREAAMAGAMG